MRDTRTLDSRRNDFPGELVARFGGVTVHARGPARGALQSPAGMLAFDDPVVLEVTTPRVVMRRYRRTLQRTLAPQQIILRGQRVRLVRRPPSAYFRFRNKDLRGMSFARWRTGHTAPANGAHA